MIIEITDITPEQVEAVNERLANDGYAYDEDFTTLYGAQWKLTGVRFMGHPVTMLRALNVAHEVLSATAARQFTLPKFGHDYIR